MRTALESPNRQLPPDSLGIEVRRVVRGLQNQTQEHGALVDRASSLEDDLKKVLKERDKLKGQKGGASKKAKGRVREILRGYEYGARHPRFTFEKTGKQIPCCPSCSGLSPKGLNSRDSDVGHKRDCWYKRILDEVEQVLR